MPSSRACGAVWRRSQSAARSCGPRPTPGDGRARLPARARYGAGAAARPLVPRPAPRVRFQLVQDNAEGLLERLRRGEVDLLLTSPLPDEPGITATPVAREPLRLVVPAATGSRGASGRAGRGAARGLRHGQRRIRAAPPGGPGVRGGRVTPRVAFEGAEIATIRGFVAAGLGVAVLPPSPVATPGQVDLPLDEPGAYRAVGLARVTSRTRTPVVAAFSDLVVSRARSASGATGGRGGLRARAVRRPLRAPITLVQGGGRVARNGPVRPPRTFCTARTARVTRPTRVT
ncbi:LysR substrate-binding domain-containing protein [Streptomyces sp. M19]